MIKILFGLLFLPFCAGFTWQLGANLFSIPYKAEVPYYFVAGSFTYLSMHFLFKKPILVYVFGHELTHALFAMLFGGSVKSFHASERGGQVAVTKSNFVITLAPYFFPLYTFIVLFLYVLTATAEVKNGAAEALIFFAGATFSFHLALTLIFLRHDQKDIREYGGAFSYPLVYLFNVVFAALLLHLLLAEKNGFLDFLKNGIIFSVHLGWLLIKEFHGLLNTFLS